MRSILFLIAVLLVVLSPVTVEGQRRMPWRKTVNINECTATTEQISRRTSLTSLPAITAPPVPPVGGGYCDPAYGYRVSRVSDGTSGSVSVDPAGKVGFNSNNTKIMTGINGSPRVYDINPETMEVSGGRNLELLQLPGVQVGYSLANIWWDTTGHPDAPTSLWIATGMQIWLASVIPNGTSVLTASLVADLSSEYTNGSIWRVYPDRTSQRISFAVQDSTRGGARLAWYVVDILSRTTSTPTTNYTIARKFKNGVDSANWYTFQMAGGLQLTSPNEAACSGGECVNGYKSSLDLSGQWILHATNDLAECTSPSAAPCGYSTKAGGPYNTFAIQNVATGQIRWAQGNGHFGMGDQRVATYNTAGFGGTCQTRPKAHLFSALSTDAAYGASANQGICYLPSFDPSGIGYGTQYTSMTGPDNTAVYVVGCEAEGACPSTVPPFNDELWSVDTGAANGSNGNFKRLARIYHHKQAGLEFIQPFISPNGQMILYLANMNGEGMKAFVVKVA